MTTPDARDLDPGPLAVTQALTWLAELATRDGWPIAQRQALTLALDEAVTNVVMHGAGGRPGAHLRVLHVAATDHIDIVLEDDGPPFDPTRVAPPPPITDLESLAIGGRGLLLMREVVSSLHHARVQGRNRLTLRWDVPGR